MIRHYESIGLIPPPTAATATTATTRITIFIAWGLYAVRELGFSIDEIRICCAYGVTRHGQARMWALGVHIGNWIKDRSSREMRETLG